MMAYLLERN